MLEGDYIGSKRFFKRSNWLLITSLFLNVILIIEISFLIIHNRKINSALRVFSVPSKNEILRPGEQVEPIKLSSLSGSIIEINYEDSLQKYVFFILSTNCPHCEKNLSVWSKIANSNTNDNCLILGISIDNIEETRKYYQIKDIGFYLTSIIDKTFRSKYKVLDIPQTILINGEGIVQNSWLGELTDEQVMEICSIINS